MGEEAVIECEGCSKDAKPKIRRKKELYSKLKMDPTLNREK